ncbi:hypothetical protein C8R44DRAFT_731380 [Mycena epipterygia]|nr:hypothetical protein C8R44DRAFT_731380 [Mycena epipterygia]
MASLVTVAGLLSPTGVHRLDHRVYVRKSTLQLSANPKQIQRASLVDCRRGSGESRTERARSSRQRIAMMVTDLTDSDAYGSAQAESGNASEARRLDVLGGGVQTFALADVRPSPGFTSADADGGICVVCANPESGMDLTYVLWPPRRVASGVGTGGVLALFRSRDGRK